MHWFSRLWRWLFGGASLPALPAGPDYLAGALGVLQERLAAARAAHHAGDPTASATIRELANELNARLIAGTHQCAGCGGLATAIVQPTGIEIGCTACHGRRVKAATREAAVAAWNATDYLPSRSS